MPQLLAQKLPTSHCLGSIVDVYIFFKEEKKTRIQLVLSIAVWESKQSYCLSGHP